MDLTILNSQRLKRLARAMQLSGTLEGWLVRAGGTTEELI
jgi:hypothetical protein